MSFNIINILKSSKIPHDLSLNQIFEHYNALSDNLSYEPSITELENYICNSSGNISLDSNIAWASNFIDPNDPDPIFDNQIYYNDRFFHNGHHYCSRQNCQSYNFLCGNSYSNQYSFMKKCGFQCNRYNELP